MRSFLILCIVLSTLGGCVPMPAFLPPGAETGTENIKVALPTNFGTTEWLVKNYSLPSGSPSGIGSLKTSKYQGVQITAIPNVKVPHSYILDFAEAHFDEAPSWDYVKEEWIKTGAKGIRTSGGATLPVHIRDENLAKLKCISYEYQEACTSPKFPGVPLKLYMTSFRCQSPHDPKMLLGFQYSERFPSEMSPQTRDFVKTALSSAMVR